MRFGIYGGDFEMMWWESLAYLLGLRGGLFIGLVFVLAMRGAMDWILSMEVDFLGGVWINQLTSLWAGGRCFMLKLGGTKK